MRLSSASDAFARRARLVVVVAVVSAAAPDEVPSTTQIPLLPSLPGAVPAAPFTHYEHLNLNSGAALWSPAHEAFYFEILRCARDPRAVGVLNLTNTVRADTVPGRPMGALSWANIGLQQFHLPSADTLEAGDDGHPDQRVRGVIVLAWPRDKLAGLAARLEDHGYAVTTTTKGTDGGLAFRGPHGNRFLVEAAPPGVDRLGPPVMVPTTTPGAAPVVALPGGPSEGVGVRGVRFDAPRGTARKICDFYAHVFGARVEYVSETSEITATCRVPVGEGQALEFVEADDVAAYDGHHVCLYVQGDAFVEAYRRLSDRDLVYYNPRFPQFHYETLDLALRFDEFRLKDIVDLETGVVLYELEHEIRTLRHRGFDPLRGLLVSEASQEEDRPLTSSSSSENNGTTTEECGHSPPVAGAPESPEPPVAVSSGGPSSSEL